MKSFTSPLKWEFVVRTAPVVSNHGQGFVPAVNLMVLDYRNEAVIERLMAEADLSHAEAEGIFNDTLKFLALAEGSMKLSPAARIDLGWHNFILHTRDYAEFCETYFGHFIHHEPGSGLNHVGPMLDVAETAALAKSVFGSVSDNWTASRGRTCGSSGC